MKDRITGRDFIKMIKPMLGIEQDCIRSMTITAKHDDVCLIEIECLGVKKGELDITEVSNAPEKRKFLVEVTEVTDAI